jgi:glycosyltransferase involved in cell wall biosynthesis
MMLAYLTSIRAYLYTGTRPASYTLGLIEAMLSGVPVVSIGAKAWGDEWGGAELFEAASSDVEDMRPIVAEDSCFDDPQDAREALRQLLEYPDKAANISRQQRARAVAMFGMDTIGPQWKALLG